MTLKKKHCRADFDVVSKCWRRVLGQHINGQCGYCRGNNDGSDDGKSARASSQSICMIETSMLI